jgi:hypothetical protein
MFYSKPWLFFYALILFLGITVPCLLAFKQLFHNVYQVQGILTKIIIIAGITREMTHGTLEYWPCMPRLLDLNDDSSLSTSVFTSK